jgi:hypothetical protein
MQKYKIINKLPQTLNLLIEGRIILLLPYSDILIDNLTKQINNLSIKGFIRVCKVKIKK